jgi:hypothetical protein
MIPALTVGRLAAAPGPGDGFDSPLWAKVPAAALAWFHPRSGPHQPRTAVRVGWTMQALHLRWRVEDRHVVVRCTADNQNVCLDSCVECFLAPVPGRGHVNVEVNAGGAVLASHVTGLAPFACRLFAPAELAAIGRHGTLPRRIDPEIVGPCTWEMGVDLPFALLSDALGAAVRPTGSWRANLYKCADRSSQPHWACWSPVGENLSFHQPDRFGAWRFA